MKILGIDTTTKFLCLGIYDDTKIYEYNLELGIRQSSLIIPTIKRVLNALGWNINDIDYFACGLGPGSFTGIRVGLATLKGMTWPINKPIVGISTLDILARNVRITEGGVIVPIIDAKRNLIYTSIYKVKLGSFKKISPYMLLTEEEFFKKIKDNAIIFGDAVSLYKQKLLSKIKGVNLLDQDYWYPKGRHIIDVALERIKAKKFNNAFNLKPVYLYPKECQVKKP